MDWSGRPRRTQLGDDLVVAGNRERVAGLGFRDRGRQASFKVLN
jgi:hypothetical protein